MLTKLAANVRNAYQVLHAVDRLARFESWFERHKQPESSADDYDHAETVNNNDRHQAVKEDLMRGIALNHIYAFKQVDRALDSVGFEIIKAADLDVQEGPGTPWYQPLEGGGRSVESFSRAFRKTPLGRRTIQLGLRFAEAFRVFPKGAAEVVRMMDQTASAYAAGGRTGLFTPLYCFLARKPL